MRNDLSDREAYERYWDSRTKEAELNFHIFVYLSRCVAEGDYHALRAFGFDLEDAAFIEQIRLPDLMALCATRSHALNASVDKESLRWLKEHMRRRRNRETLKTELLRAEAPFELMRQLFGMSGKDYAAARLILGQPSGKGRPALAGERDEQLLWHLWVLCAKADKPSRMRHEDLWLVIGRELDSTICAAWHTVEAWARDDGMLRAFRAEREKLTPQQMEQEERQLRDKHAVSSHDIELRLPAQPTPPPLAQSAGAT
jgi:hypothetical protein